VLLRQNLTEKMTGRRVRGECLSTEAGRVSAASRGPGTVPPRSGRESPSPQPRRSGRRRGQERQPHGGWRAPGLTARGRCLHPFGTQDVLGAFPLCLCPFGARRWTIRSFETPSWIRPEVFRDGP